MNIGEVVGIHPPVQDYEDSPKIVDNNTRVGVEIELEQIEGSVVIDKALSSGLWSVTRDGSLREGGLEFIMQARTGEPLKGGEIIAALDAFDDFIKAPVERGVAINSRTSIHVHLDVRALSPEELNRLILLYYTFEEILFNWIGSDRRQSSYCRRLADHPDIIPRVAAVLEGKDLRGSLGRGNKYDALNLASVRQHGSLEFRGMRATTDTDIILQWINILLKLHQAARNMEVEIGVIPEVISAEGPLEFLEQVFGEHTAALGVVSDYQVVMGARVAQELLLDPRNGRALGSPDTIECQTRLDLFKEKVLGD